MSPYLCLRIQPRDLPPVRDERNGKQTTYGSLDVFGKLTVVKKALRTPVHRQGGLIRRIVEAKEKLQKTRR